MAALDYILAISITVDFFLSHWIEFLHQHFPSHSRTLIWCKKLKSFHMEEKNLFITLRLRQNGRHFADDIFKCIFLKENVWILIKISFKFVPKCPINNISSLVQMMAWHRSGYKPLSEPMMVSLLTHICVTRPQWVILYSQYDDLATQRARAYAATAWEGLRYVH